jgi:hypothetical protein
MAMEFVDYGNGGVVEEKKRREGMPTNSSVVSEED